MTRHRFSGCLDDWMDDLLGFLRTSILSRGSVCVCVCVRTCASSHVGAGGASAPLNALGELLQGLSTVPFLEILILPGEEKICLWTDVVSKSSPHDSCMIILHSPLGITDLRHIPSFGGHSVP